METIYNLRLFIIIAIMIYTGYLLGRKDLTRGWRESAIVLISGMLVYFIIHWPPPV